MKGLGFSSILLVLTTVLIVISVALMGLVVYRAATTTAVADFWKDNKLYMMAPTVMNVVSMALLGVLFAMG